MIGQQIVGATIVFLSPIICLAQTPSGQAQPSIAQDQTQQKVVTSSDNRTAAVPLLNGLKPATVPEGDGAWVVQIATSGGLLGSGKGNIEVTSVGGLACTGTKLAEGKQLVAEALQPVAQLVAAVRSDEWKPPLKRTRSHCNDCYRTALVLSRREADGTVKLYTARWDDVTKGQVAQEALQLYERVMTVAACQQ